MPAPVDFPPEELIVLRLDSLAFGGDAVGRDADGRVVFVPGGAPGDRVEVRLVERKRDYSRGELVRVLDAGRRIQPPCSLADECGGCPWQHVEAVAQIDAKHEIVAHALERTGAEVARILPAPAGLGYRSRARMTGRGGIIGFQARRTHRVVDIPTCIALDPALDAALKVARAELRGSLGEGGSVSGLVGAGGSVQLDIECGIAGLPETLADQAASLVGRAGIVGIAVHLPRSATRIYGEPRLDLGGGFLGSAGGFQQANANQNSVLRRLVLDWAIPEDARGQSHPLRVLELYAGDGNFSRDLVKWAKVVAVEAERRAAARLVENLRRVAPRAQAPTAPERWSVRAETASVAVRKLSTAGEHFDVVVLDPPRAGAAEILENLAALTPARIVYVSCDPMTLARDLIRLGDCGYRAVCAQPIDMMPHTSHIEVVALLERMPS